ncbi:heme ABC transporter ATP-binding protein [Alkaliphilus hydrothermalis]|uniref:Iron complex transport system ATP-binding protein n=1 Tax=Alkaliphilus hydrothermalis TaxID=1482730 RepID=A0ABS2NNA2_9FIRM|nr:heme ABC transporter ATP-binding protein [Alkaliphilus hydrothermalis]MBM7614410.1 iron complex transport system ATP-binding protein [Alkaliphilus hydrothermalis]
MKNSISTKAITFKYDESTIVDEISLQVKSGSFLTIIGPNGSGKSTLLKLIAANLTPDEGTILINDRQLTSYKMKDLAKEMAVVPQDTNVAYDFDVFDIVLMGRNPHLKRFQKEGDADFAIVRDAMEQTNTWHLRERKVNEISGGERQRVIIARALAQQPKIILLDEPTSSLDIHHQIEVLELLKRLNQEKEVTIVAVLHDMNLAARYSQEVLLLHVGKIITMGKTEDVMTVENLQRAYKMEMIIQRNIYTNALEVIPLSLSAKKEKRTNKKIHLVCGGGTGKELLQHLLEEGYKVSMGVVNVGDSDWELGKLLAIPMAEEKPFSEISEEALGKAEKLANESNLSIMTSVPIGWGNIKNLQLVKNQLQQSKKVFLYKQNLWGERTDFTEGRGNALIEELKSLGLQEISTMEELLNQLGEYK